MSKTICVPFGTLPIGTTFERNVCVRDPRDRRRKIFVRWTYTKTTHGSIAGFAKGPNGLWRSDHAWPVYIAADLRLVVSCLRSKVAS